MSIDALNRWLSLVANLAVLAGIVFLAVELRQNSEFTALQLEFGQPTQKIFEINRDLQSPETARIFAKAIERPSDLTFEEGLVASSLVLNFLNEMEDRYLIHKAGLANEVDWQRHIRENIGWVLGNAFAVATYKGNRDAFEDEFVEYVDSLLPEVPPNGTHDWWLSMRSEFADQEPEAN